MLIEDGLLSSDKSSPLIKHVTFTDICHSCSLNSQGFLYLYVEISFGYSSNEFLIELSDQFEVGLVYYRTAYAPEQFHSEEVNRMI